METLINGAIPWAFGFPKFNPSNKHRVKPRTVRCLRKNDEVNGLFEAPSQMDLEGHAHMKMSQSPESDPDTKHNEIWQLFREAQRNILYLNKQRLMAVEELKKAKTEKEMLLDRIQKLEEENQADAGKDKLSILWDLLLRIDSMVLKGMIDTGEASDFRRLVMNSNAIVADVFFDIMQRKDVELLAELRHFSDKNKRNGFHIVHICTEMVPVVSVGSLASYVTGLSHALQRQGNLVEVILPKYASLDLDEVQGLREIEAEFYSYFNGQLQGNRIWTGVVYGIGVTFIQPVHYSTFFTRERLYGYPDDFERFSYFSRASLDYIVKSGKQPDVLHIHNWETAIVGPLFWDVFVKQGLGGTRIMLTCHDFGSQCLEQPDKLALCGLDSSRLHRSDRLQDNTKGHLANILKGGVVYSNKVVIMSSMHSKASIIHSLSHGLESTFTIHKDKLLIAPYGFDKFTWDPSRDKFLPENYTADNMKGKAVCKVALQQHLGLTEHASVILVGCIFSEVSDVDLENLKEVVLIASRRNVQFVFTRLSKVPSKNTSLDSFLEEIKDENVRFIDKCDEALSHLIFAGSDIILCPSFHDPMLQVPLKAMRYGAAPIAITSIGKRFRHVVDHDFQSTKLSQFLNTTFAYMSLNEALDEIKSNSMQWNQKIMDAMTKDFSWDAECYDMHISAYTALKNL
ncbi:probable starch synthase 4, chloroplastic/amyloplastic [Vitis vinifera]|uniref:starch synthase n=1 Tax=Vitis vinifera TaxID=29760 RepID=B2ZGM8_VITVI|nr:probable starch synthase 4, chloroplastic/amyloplastic [Vitis vinifera]ACD13789.1 starch synthase V precursor [Vitis vinifera]|eukprot:NP_001290013.1 probable starch synthase 4, chloroplastic/amyloplastic [Vitis vinifera]